MVKSGMERAVALIGPWDEVRQRRHIRTTLGETVQSNIAGVLPLQFNSLPLCFGGVGC